MVFFFLVLFLVFHYLRPNTYPKNVIFQMWVELFYEAIFEVGIRESRTSQVISKYNVKPTHKI